MAGGLVAGIVLFICVSSLTGPAPDPQGNAALPTATDMPAVADVPTESESVESPGAKAQAEPDGELVTSPYASETMVTSWKILNGVPQTDRPLGLPECAQVDDSYFNGAVFVGDSISMRLQQYVTSQRQDKYPTMLGDAVFLTAGSLGSHNLVGEVKKGSLHPVLYGQKMTLEDALVTLNASKVYIMLGMNDANYYKEMQTSIDNMMELIHRIREKMPNLEIYIQSATPRYTGEKPSTQQLFDYDMMLYDEILKLGDPNVFFVDIAYIMRDESGNLFDYYCSDKEGMAMHFNGRACLEWIKYLYTHANI